MSKLWAMIRFLESRRADLLMLCHHFNVSATNCSCEQVPAICDAKMFIHTAHTNMSQGGVYYRRRVVTVVYATLTTISSILGIGGELIHGIRVHQYRSTHLTQNTAAICFMIPNCVLNHQNSPRITGFS